jgi:PDZ domain-containing secreted protein
VSAVSRDTPVDLETGLTEIVSQQARGGFNVLLTALNGTPVTNYEDYVDTVSKMSDGEKVTATFLLVTTDSQTYNRGPLTEEFHVP